MSSISVLQRVKDKQVIETALQKFGINGGLASIKKKDFSADLIHLLKVLFDDVVDPLVKLQVAKTLATSPPANFPEIEEFFLSRYKQTGNKLNQLGMDSLAWGLANLLVTVSSGNPCLAEHYCSLAVDSRLGSTRQMILIALAKLAHSNVEDVLIELLDDPAVIGHAAMALGMIRSSKSLPKLEQVSKNAEAAWVKKEAAKAISSIKKSKL